MEPTPSSDATPKSEQDLFRNQAIKEELKNRIKAVLYATSRGLTLKEITRLVKKRDTEPVLYLLCELQEEYKRQSEPIALTDEQKEVWKLMVREKYVPVVEKLVTQVELPKTVVETLAIIAWKAPVTQSEVIHVRTNKAYQHVKDLEDAGYITAEKYGRTKLLKLTQKFYDYFDMDKEALRKNIQSVQPEKKQKIRNETMAEGAEVFIVSQDGQEEKQKESAEESEQTESKEKDENAEEEHKPEEEKTEDSLEKEEHTQEEPHETPDEENSQSKQATSDEQETPSQEQTSQDHTRTP